MHEDREMADHQVSEVAVHKSKGQDDLISARPKKNDSGPFNSSNSPFSWMLELIDLKKEKSFFETRVTERQAAGALSWE